MKIMIQTASIFILLTLMLSAQAIPTEEVLVRSWKKGEEKIADQVIRIRLDTSNSEFEKEIVAISGKKYRLRIVKNPDKNLKSQHWKVELREVSCSENGKSILGNDLLYSTRPGDTGGDSFSRQNLASFFYPYEGNQVMVNGIPMSEWTAFYPTKTIRKFLVDGFIVIIKSGTLEFDRSDETTIRLFELSVEFKQSTDY